MYTVKYEAHKQLVELTDLTLERAIVYKKRMKRRGITVDIVDQVQDDTKRNLKLECHDGVCGFNWHPQRNVTV